MPVFSDDYTIKEGDLGPNIDKKWKDKIKVGETASFKFEKGKALFYANKGAKLSTCLGKVIGKRELVWRLGWWVSEMTEKGSKRKASAAAKVLPTKWQAGNLVARQEQNEKNVQKRSIQSG